MAGNKEGRQPYQVVPDTQAENRRSFLWGSATAVVASVTLQYFYKDANRAIDKSIEQGNRAAQQAEADGAIPPSEKNLEFARQVRSDMHFLNERDPLRAATEVEEAAKSKAREIYKQNERFTTKRNENKKAIQEQEGGKSGAFFARLFGDIVAAAGSAIFTGAGLIQAGRATYSQYEAVNKKAQEIGISRRDFLRGKFPESQPPQGRPQQ